MNEKRNITIDITTAKKWYKEGGDLKEIALQAFSKKELQDLPSTWEEGLDLINHNNINSYFPSKEIAEAVSAFPSKEIAEAVSALHKLLILRCVWVGNWKQGKSYWSIYKDNAGNEEGFRISMCQFYHNMFSFPSKEMATEFYNCFKNLFKIARFIL